MAKTENDTNAASSGSAKSSRAAATKPERQAVEDWATELDTPRWLLAAARQKHGWPQGRLLTRAEFEKALRATEGEVIR